MNRIKRMRTVRDMSQAELARKAGMIPQTLNSYESGARNPGAKVLPVLAEALKASSAYLRGDAETIPVVDFADGSVAQCEVAACEQIDGYGALYLVDHPEVGMMSVILADGVQFTPDDWQGEQCMDASDVGRSRWVDARGNEAIMLDGLPRILV